MLQRWSIPYHTYVHTDAGLSEQDISSINSGHESDADTESAREDTNAVIATSGEDWQIVPAINQNDFDAVHDLMSSSVILPTTKVARSPLGDFELLLNSDLTDEPTRPLPEEELLDIVYCQGNPAHNQRLHNGNGDHSINKSAQSALLEAIRASNETLATLLLETGANPDSNDAWGPAMTQALRAGLESLTRLLLAKGANPNAKDVWGPALTQAIRAKNEPLAMELLKRGACPNATDAWGPAVTQAVRARNGQLAIMLIEYGADPRGEDSWGSVVSQSMKYNLSALTTVLLHAGAVQ